VQAEGPTHDSGLVWDNHACLPLREIDEFLPQLARYRAAGVDVVTVNIGDSLVPLDRMIRTAASIRHFVGARPGEYLLGLSTADLREARSTGRLAVCMDVEGVHALGTQVSLVEFLHGIGVRWMLMVYNRRNLAGSGCHDSEDEGLTDLGRAMLAEMDRVGMVKCCSHTGYRTAREILDGSDRPVIFSHSNPRALRDHPRNIPDDLIRACASTGGVVGINGVGLFLGTGPPTPEAIVRNIDYVAQLVGAEHVAIALDYMFKGSELDEPGRGGPATWPREWGYGRGTGFAPPEVIPEVRAGLGRLGYPGAAIRGILGDNWLHVADRVWS
jgi:membrane dipeptidase